MLFLLLLQQECLSSIRLDTKELIFILIGSLVDREYHTEKGMYIIEQTDVKCQDMADNEEQFL